MSKKQNSRALRDFGMIDEYYNLGCSVKTIARLTGLTIPNVKKVINEIEKKKALQKELQSKEDVK